MISVGSSKKAAAYFELALKRAPDFPGNQAQAAAYYAWSATARARRRWRPPSPPVATWTRSGPDAAEWRQLARDVSRDCR